MNVTIIYDSMESHPIRIVKWADEVRFFGEQKFGKTNHWLRGFDSLEDVFKWATNEKEYNKKSSEHDFIFKRSFACEDDFCRWISLLCEDMYDLEEIYTFNYRFND